MIRGGADTVDSVRRGNPEPSLLGSKPSLSVRNRHFGCETVTLRRGWFDRELIYLANTVRIGHKVPVERNNQCPLYSRPEFHSEEAAFAHLERIVWNGATVCPHCGGMDRITAVRANPARRIRIGLHRCGNCKRQFTVKIGTVFEHMRLPLHKALQAAYLITSSKKRVSAHQLHRTLEITYKSAWFLMRRIREAMRDGMPAPVGPAGGIVEGI